MNTKTRTKKFIADRDAADPEGAARRARYQRQEVRRLGRPLPELPSRGLRGAELDAVDPEGAARRAYQRAVSQRRKAREAGLPLPELPPVNGIARLKLRGAELDARDPGGAEERARARAYRHVMRQRTKAEKFGLPLPELPPRKPVKVQRADLDPFDAWQRAYSHTKRARKQALRAGVPVDELPPLLSYPVMMAAAREGRLPPAEKLQTGV